MAPMKVPSQHDPNDERDDSYSLTHLAHRWGVTRKAVRQLILDGELSFFEADGQIRVPLTAVEQIERIKPRSA